MDNRPKFRNKPPPLEPVQNRKKPKPGRCGENGEQGQISSWYSEHSYTRMLELQILVAAAFPLPCLLPISVLA